MDLQKLITNQNHVSLRLAHHVALSSTESTSTNLVFSPLSLHVVLNLIAAGSSGPTRDELLSVLGSDSCHDLNKLSSELASVVFADGSGSGGPKLSFANGAWIDRSLDFKPGFKRVVQNSYKAASSRVDFLNKAAEVVSEVNSWAEEHTNGLVKDLLPSDSVDNTTRLIFANALYFKGEWDQKFDASKTIEDDFYLRDGSSVKVPYMTTYKKQFIETFEGFKVLALPYAQGQDNKRRFTMYFILPDEKDGLSALSEKMSSEPDFLIEHLTCQKKVMVDEFRLPRFKISYGFEATEVLKALGINRAFSGGGLTEMVGPPEGQNLGVSCIFHKAFIEVNEEGTEAAAASAGGIMLMCMPPTDDFVADHPFMYLIREDTTGAVLFVGHVANPLEN